MGIGDTARPLDLVVEAHGVPDRDPLQPPPSGEELDDVAVGQIGRQPRIDARDIAGHAGEEIDTHAAQQCVQDRLVDLRRAISRRQRRNVLFGARLDLRRDAAPMQAERRVETAMGQIEIARDRQRAAQFADSLVGAEMGALVEPFRHQHFGARARRNAFAFDLDIHPHEGLRRRVDDHGTEPERADKRDRPLKEGDITYDQAWSDGFGQSMCPNSAKFNRANLG